MTTTTELDKGLTFHQESYEAIPLVCLRDGAGETGLFLYTEKQLRALFSGNNGDYRADAYKRTLRRMIRFAHDVFNSDATAPGVTAGTLSLLHAQMTYYKRARMAGPLSGSVSHADVWMYTRILPSDLKTRYTD